MRIGLLSDVHGNLPALEAVLARLEHASVDRVVCLGDVAVGPWGSETLKLLRRLGPDTVVGNWDAWVTDGVPPCADTPIGRKLLEMGAFWAEQLDDEDRAYLREAKQELELDGGRVACFHGSPRSYNEPILPTTPPAEIEEMLDGRTASVVVVGHTHLQLTRRLPGTTLVNPGSVGMPFVEWPAPFAEVCPWAEYGVIELGEEDELAVELHRVPYDSGAVVRRTLESGVPHAEWWTASWVRA